MENIYKMSNEYKEKSNPFILFLMLLFISYLVYWVFTSQYSEGKYIAKAHPHESIGGNVEEEVKADKFKIGKVTSESKALGNELYQTTCKSCHGATGLGDGSAAAALNPPARNFTQLADFKFGYSPENLLATLDNGSPGTSMASFKYLSNDEKISIVHYIRSIMPVSNETATSSSETASIDGDANSTATAVASAEEDYLDASFDAKAVSAAMKEIAPSTGSMNAMAITLPKEEKLKALFQSAAQNVRVASYSHVYVSSSEELKNKLSSYASFKNFVLSENVFNMIGESFASASDAELRSLYQQINDK
jgi:mono/diheme cytochrome c family protein